MKKSILLALKQIRLHWKGTFMMVLLLSMSMVAGGMVLLYRCTYDHSEKLYRDILSAGVEKTGYLYIQDGKYQSEEAKLFLEEAFQSEGIEAIGCIGGPYKVGDRLSRLAEIQSRYAGKEDERELEWCYVDLTVLGLCSPAFEQRMEESAEKEGEEPVFGLYLGANFREIPVGTRYREKITEEYELVYEVRGIFKEGEAILSPSVMNGLGAGRANPILPLDNQVLFFGPVSPPSSCWMYSVSKDMSITEGSCILEGLAEKYGLPVSFSSVQADVDYNKMKMGQYRYVFTELFVIISVVAVIISFTVFLVRFLNHTADYGILCANGFSPGDLQLEVFWENIMICVMSFFLSVAILFFLQKDILAYSDPTAEMRKFILFHNVIPGMSVVALCGAVLYSVVPAIVLGNCKPITLIRGERV